MSFSNYKGNLELGAGLTPSGEGYPLMQTCDIMAADDGTRLDVILANMTSNLGANIDGELAEQARLIQEIKASLQDKSSNNIYIQDGFWYINGENTGVKAVGIDGKSAYEYALSVGYTGTEAEFAEMLAGIDNSMCGTWVFNDTIEVLTGDHEMKFTNSADENFVGIHYVENGPMRVLTYVYADGSGTSEAYWYYPEYKWNRGRINQTVVITEEPEDEVIKSWIKNNAKKSGIQQEADVRLKTKDKRIVDAINELSDQISEGGTIDTSTLATIDKIASISAEGDFSNINTDNGLYWVDSSTIAVDDNDYDNIPSINRVPITAGENVTFEVDEEKKLVKINATGGGEIDTSTLATVDKITHFNFRSGSNSYVEPTAEGILWDNEETEIEADEGNYYYSSSGNRVPIVAGNNITFEVDDEKKVVKINAAGGEIDTSNLATVDKVRSIDIHYDGVSLIDASDGITWQEGFEFNDGYGSTGKTIANGSIHHRVPIVAGDNVTFTVDEENQVVKINATGGGSSTPSVSLIGTWTVVDEPTIPTSDLPLEFTSNNGQTYTAIGTTSMGSSSWGINALSYQVKDAGYYEAVYVNNPSGQYGIAHGWKIEAGKYITITKEPTDANAIAWLGDNTDAPKVELPKEEMPQIRFTSGEGNNDSSNLSIDEETPLKLTVEIVGGGALKVGDALQVCRRREYLGSRANGFRKKHKLQRFAEYVVTEADLDKRYLTIPIYLTKKTFRGFFRDSLPTSGISPIYLRIRRPKGDMQDNDSGQTVNAEFSNVVTIWKNHWRGSNTIKLQ